MFDKSGAGYDQLLDNIRGDLLVFAHTKDHASQSRQVRVGVVLTPQLEKMFVRIAPPAYTGIKPEEKPYTFQAVQALEGGEIKFRLQSNRPLREGALELTSGEQAPQRIALAKSGDKEVSGSFIAGESGRMRFSFVDTSALASQGDFEGALTVTHDLPPEVHLAQPEQDALVAVDFKLQAQIEASDDYGLREVRLHRGLNGVFSAPKTYGYTNIVRDSRETFDFNFAELGLQPGDVISLFAEALDNAPQPHLSRSQTVRLQVISVEDYNDLLREQSDIADAEAKYAELNDDLQALIERQKQLGEETQKLNEQLAKAGGQGTRRAPAAIGQNHRGAKRAEPEAQPAGRAHGGFRARHSALRCRKRICRNCCASRPSAIRQSTRTNEAAVREIAQRSSPPGGATAAFAGHARAH